HPDCDRFGHWERGRFDPATTSVCPVQPMPRLSSHPQLTQCSHSQDKGTPGFQHLASMSRTCCSRGERTALRRCEGHPVPFALRHIAGNALIPQVVLLDLSALARGFHSNSSPPPFPEHQQGLLLLLPEPCNRRNAGMIPPTAVPSVCVSSRT